MKNIIKLKATSEIIIQNELKVQTNDREDTPIYSELDYGFAVPHLLLY